MPLPRLDSTVIPHSRTPRRSPWGTSATVSGSVPGCRSPESGRGANRLRPAIPSGSDSDSDSTQPRGPVRSRFPATAPGHGVGHGPRRCGSLGSPITGLPSRSALVAPPLRLAALRWRGAFNVLTRVRPPPGVSTACLVAATHFSVTESRGSPTRYCAHRNSNAGGTIPCTARPPMREFSCSEGPENRVRREARVGANRRCGAPAGPTGAVPVISPVAFRSPACHSSFSDDWLRHARFGEPASGAATAGSAGARNGHGHGPRARRRPRTEPLHGTQTPAAATGTAISRGARRGHGSDGFLVAWASSPRMDHQRSERRPHGGQDAHRTMGSIATGGPYGPAAAAGSGSATARSARARCGHGSRTRPSDTGSATDEAVAENPGQGG
jgi:hypothetical protein